MTEKRFTETVSTGIVTDNVTGKEFNCDMRIDDELLELLNNLSDENEQLKSSDTITDLETEIMKLKEENKFLRNKVTTYKSGNALLKKTLDKEWK